MSHLSIFPIYLSIYPYDLLTNLTLHFYNLLYWWHFSFTVNPVTGTGLNAPLGNPSFLPHHQQHSPYIHTAAAPTNGNQTNYQPLHIILLFYLSLFFNLFPLLQTHIHRNIFINTSLSISISSSLNWDSTKKYSRYSSLSADRYKTFSADRYFDAYISSGYISDSTKYVIICSRKKRNSFS